MSSTHFSSVAILIPTYNNHKVLKKQLRYLEKLKPQPKFYVFCTNNVKDSTLTVLDKWQLKHQNTLVLHTELDKDIIKQSGSPYTAIAMVRQLLLDTARKLSVDYAIFLDDDVFVGEEDLIIQLASAEKDLVGGGYFRYYPHAKLMSYITTNESGELKHCPYIMRNYQLHKTFKVVAVGGGCMCISKKLLMDSRINFYPIYTYIGNKENAEDYAYCVQASSFGYEVWVNDDLRLCHYQIHQARPWRKKNDKEYVDFEF